MTDEAKKYLSDIQRAIARIEIFTEGVDSYGQYQADLKTKSAVERQLGIVGEAVSQFLKRDSAVQLAHARKIVDFRNHLIHAYDSVNDAVVWAILKNHLPNLKLEVEQLLVEQ